MAKQIACPHCGKPVKWTPESTWRPFCSERCRLIDLGEWLNESHRISDAEGSADGGDAEASWGGEQAGDSGQEIH